jgi:hypothetical protein
MYRPQIVDLLAAFHELSRAKRWIGTSLASTHTPAHELIFDFSLVRRHNGDILHVGAAIAFVSLNISSLLLRKYYPSLVGFIYIFTYFNDIPLFVLDKVAPIISWASLHCHIKIEIVRWSTGRIRGTHCFFAALQKNPFDRRRRTLAQPLFIIQSHNTTMATENNNKNDDTAGVKNDDMQKWELDPRESFSDWTLEIALDDDPGRIDTYHVHRFALAVGERKSGYFERLFNSKGFLENETQTTRIKLAPSAAAAIPTMLSFMYDVSAPLSVCTNTAVELYQLGQYFDIPPMRNQAREFRECDMTLENCHVYYTQATSGVHIKSVLQAVKKTC